MRAVAVGALARAGGRSGATIRSLVLLGTPLGRFAAACSSVFCHRWLRARRLSKRQAVRVCAQLYRPGLSGRGCFDLETRHHGTR